MPRRQHEIDRYVEQLYAETKEWIATHPFIDSPNFAERSDTGEGTATEEPAAEVDLKQ